MLRRDVTLPLAPGGWKRGSWLGMALLIGLAMGGFPVIAGDGGDSGVAGGAAATIGGDGNVRLTLLSEVKRVQAGTPFYVGLHLEHAPGWHTYWKNPGLVGVDTSLDWKLPPGWKAGPIEWPAPQKTLMATVIAYGYEGDATLLVEITPPNDWKADHITLEARGGWMACATSCHPGWFDFALTLPVSQGEPEWNSEVRPLFDKSRASFPREVPDWRFEAEKEPGGDEGEGAILLTVHPPRDAMGERPPAESWKGIYFFSEDGQIHSDRAQAFIAHEDGAFSLRLPISQYGPEEADSLPGILYSDEGWPPLKEVKAMKLAPKLR